MKQIWNVLLAGLLVAGALAPASGADKPAPPETPDISLTVQQPGLAYDGGKMSERIALNMSGATVEFFAPAGKAVSGTVFYGARYGKDATSQETLAVTVSDANFKPIRRFDKPLTNLSPGREVWQTLTFDPPVKVSGKFYVTLAYNSTRDKGIYIGVDQTNPSGYSKVGLPGTVPSDVDSPYNWMIRALTVNPEEAATRAASVSARSAAAIAAASAAVAPGHTSPLTASAANSSAMARAMQATKAMRNTHPKPMSPSGAVLNPNAKLAYRDPYRRLTFRNKAPILPKGSGRVAVRWNLAPVTIELNYVGKPKRILDNLNVKQLVVDFPVPQPGLFNVVVKKPGYKSAAREFRVVNGSRAEWRVALQPGADAAEPMREREAPVVPIIREEPMGHPEEAAPGAPPAPEGGEPNTSPRTMAPPAPRANRAGAGTAYRPPRKRMTPPPGPGGENTHRRERLTAPPPAPEAPPPPAPGQ